MNGTGRQSPIAHIYRDIAMMCTNSLPENIQPDLIIAWSGDQRGDIIPDWQLENPTEAIDELFSRIKIDFEAAEREGGLNGQAGPYWFLALIYFLMQDRALDFNGACKRYNNRLRRGELLPATDEALDDAAERFRQELYDWLDREGIPFSRRTPIRLSKNTVLSALERFRNRPDVYFDSEIPADKLANAAKLCNVFDNDSVYILLDCTYWGSAKDAVLICDRGIYYQNTGSRGFLSYAEFPDRTFYSTTDEQVSTGVESINLSGSSVQSIELVTMLDLLKGEVLRASTKLRTSEDAGLDSIAGMGHLKEILLEEVVAPLRNPEKFRKYKIEIPNGILLYGPPGCGKTFVAQRLADELGYKFFEISPSVIGSPYIHETTVKIAKIFDEARKSAPCVIFADEFEGLVPSRESLGGNAQYKSEEVNEWLVQIGSCAESQVLFVAATNAPWNIDRAVQRSGRLDKKIYVGPPDKDALLEILHYHLDGRPIASKAEVERFADEIADLGYAASDLKLLADEAAKAAMKRDVAIGYRELTEVAANRVSPSLTESLVLEYEAFAGRG